MTDEMKTTEEAAALLSLSPRTLSTWRTRGGGPRWVRYSARCVRYRLSDLIEFVEERMRSNTSEVGQ